MTKTLFSAISMASLALSASALDAGAEKLCSIVPSSYGPAKTEYPHLAHAIDVVEEYPTAFWYTDRLPANERAAMLQRIISECPEDSRMVIVVYGLPNKDCASGVSTAGSVNSTASYKEFLMDLTTAVGNRKVLYVVEPDAAALLVDDSNCAPQLGYLENLKIAIEILSKNKFAECFADVGYWSIRYEELRAKVVKVIQELNAYNQLHGIVLNTRNYRSTPEMTELCTLFHTAMGSTTLKCIIDTSRNNAYIESTSEEWCNVLTAGIGEPPTSMTNITEIAYFLWLKTIGESDGKCNNGPEVGVFYETGFQRLWDQGYFVQKLGMDPIVKGGNTAPPQKTGLSQSEQNTGVTPTEPIHDSSQTDLSPTPTEAIHDYSEQDPSQTPIAAPDAILSGVNTNATPTDLNQDHSQTELSPTPDPNQDHSQTEPSPTPNPHQDHSQTELFPTPDLNQDHSQTEPSSTPNPNNDYNQTEPSPTPTGPSQTPNPNHDYSQTETSPTSSDPNHEGKPSAPPTDAILPGLNTGV